MNFIKRGEKQNKQQYRNALNKVSTNSIELPSKLLEQITYITSPKKEEHVLIVVDKSTHEEHLYQPLQTNNKQFKTAVTFLTGYNGIFNVTNSNKKFYFRKSITDEDGFVQITKPPGAYKTEALDKKKRTTSEDLFTEANYPFKIKPNFSTLGSLFEISPQRPINSFMFDDSIRDLLGFNERTLYEDYNLSTSPVDITSFNNIFIETDIAKGMTFKGKRSGIIMNFTMSVSPRYEYVCRFEGGVQWFMMESKDVISSSPFKLKNENNELVSFNGQSISFRLSVKEI